MTSATLDPGSFRDPKGYVYLQGDRVFRVVSSKGAAHFEAVWASGVLESLSKKGLLVATKRLAKTELPTGLKGPIVLEHPRLSPITYPYEWSFEGLRAAALAHIDLHLALLQAGFTLSDASAYNMQFVGSRPVHIDVLSIVPYQEGMLWAGFEQFKRHFLYPLIFESETGADFTPWYRGTIDGMTGDTLLRCLPWRALASPSRLAYLVAPVLYDRKARQKTSAPDTSTLRALPKARLVALLEHLRRIIVRLKPPRKRDSAWLNYTRDNNYASAEEAEKLHHVREFVSDIRPNVLVDIGCNTGLYSKAAIVAGAKSVIGLEMDRAALDEAYKEASRSALYFLPIQIDVTNPSPACGWANRERSAFRDRLQADAMVALAVLHHIVIGANVPLVQAVAELVGMASQGLIEFVPKTDAQVKRMLTLREDIFDDYTLEGFAEALSHHAKILSQEPIASSGRQLFRYKT